MLMSCLKQVAYLDFGGRLVGHGEWRRVPILSQLVKTAQVMHICFEGFECLMTHHVP